MYSTPTLATRFARNTRVIRANEPLSEDQMRAAAPSIFAEGKHSSRSERYTYIPTIEVLRGLRKEGFEPFMAAQGTSRVEGKEAFTKHMIRMRHAGQVVTRTMLLEGVWDYHFDPQTNVIDVHVSRLRQKVDKPFPISLIQTVRNAGYMLRAEPA